MNFATIEAASLISIANTNIESTFKSIKKARRVLTRYGGQCVNCTRVIVILEWASEDSITKNRRISDGWKTGTFMQYMAFE